MNKTFSLNYEPHVLLWPIPVAPRSKKWDYDRSLVGIAGSNPALTMKVCLVNVVCWIEESASDQSPIQRNVTKCMSFCVISCKK